MNAPSSSAPQNAPASTPKRKTTLLDVCVSVAALAAAGGAAAVLAHTLYGMPSASEILQTGAAAAARQPSPYDRDVSQALQAGDVAVGVGTARMGCSAGRDAAIAPVARYRCAFAAGAGPDAAIAETILNAGSGGLRAFYLEQPPAASGQAAGPVLAYFDFDEPRPDAHAAAATIARLAWVATQRAHRSGTLAVLQR